MKQKSHLTKSGYEITFQIFNDNLNHIYINDRNLYPDSDSRSQDPWRTYGLLIPVNDKKDLKKIKKLFK